MHKPQLVLCWFEAIVVDGFGPWLYQDTKMIQVESSAHIQIALERALKLDKPARWSIRDVKLLKYRPEHGRPHF